MKTSIFAYGFRSHFLLAGLAAIVLVPLWALSLVAGFPVGAGWPPTLWHAHEMLFGFIMSAVAGFMLTAVPSWTGQKGFASRPLIILAVLWLSARALIARPVLWPPLLIGAVDLAFLPALAILIAQPLLREQNRNTPLLVVIGLLWLSNLVFHVGIIRHDESLALHAVIAGIDVVLILVTVIGGRIVPAFTAAALRQRAEQGAVQSRSALTALAVAAMVAVAVGDVFWPDTKIAGSIAGMAAGVQGLRLLQWGTLRTLRQPIVWVLHLAYAWLPVGLALKAVALLGGFAIAAFWLHALTIGALGTMILAVMTRVALGHTGRPLIVARPIALAYLLLTASALVRVFGLWGLRLGYSVVIIWSASFWTAAFMIFVVVYAPILWMPRIDGKAG